MCRIRFSLMALMGMLLGVRKAGYLWG
ncbi:hypothetical protein LS74_005450 [Helicobacter magdeburgensis]|uniref:Uncharacterized protein n=1 Tax=Helicobacter magdeburgensis TaxID=471858 RepID=A0A4V6I1I9_9HELI|nr:hypothetical protein LS74_005450 [Helicobacter magdeburgensis]